MATTGSNTTTSAERPRLVLAVALGILGCLLLASGNVAIWAWRTSTDTDTWTGATNPLLDDQDFVAGVSAYLTDLVLEQVDIQALADQYLPGPLSALGGPAEDVARGALDEIIRDAIDQPAVKDVVRFANENGHALAYDVLTDQNRYLRLDGDQIVLDLDPALQSVADRVNSLGVDLYPDGVPDGTAKYELATSTTLGDAKQGLDTLEVLRWAMPLAGLALLAGSLAVSRRRDLALIALGAGVGASALVVLAVQAAGRSVVFSRVTDPIEKVAGTKLWDAAAAGLVRQTLGLVLLGGVMAGIGALLARGTPRVGVGPAVETRPPGPHSTPAGIVPETWPLEPPPAPPSP